MEWGLVNWVKRGGVEWGAVGGYVIELVDLGLE